jgi:SWI/SNF-related matrix-associated actin-dependent regulator 1 of chromatin subfamily A
LTKNLDVKTLILDEAHLIKNSKAQRARTIKRISKNIPYIIALTGTPVVNRPVEFFNSLNMISPERFPSFWDYAQEYCGATHNGYGWDFKGATNIEKLNKLLIESVMIRRLKADVMKDLPAKIKTLVPLEINNRNKYQDLFNHTLRDSKYKEPGDVLSEIEQLKQICLDGKIDSIYAWIDDFLKSGQKLVVFATHHKAIDMLMDRYGQIAVKLDGRDNQTQRQGAVDSFQNIDECKLFIGNIKAAGIGITLHAASNVAFVELPWTPADIDQSSDRVHRIGQEADCVNIYYLVAEDSIEEDICELLDEKRKVIDMVLDGKATEEVSLLTELLNRMRNK